MPSVQTSKLPESIIKPLSRAGVGKTTEVFDKSGPAPIPGLTSDTGSDRIKPAGSVTDNTPSMFMLRKKSRLTLRERGERESPDQNPSPSISIEAALREAEALAESLGGIDKVEVLEGEIFIFAGLETDLSRLAERLPADIGGWLVHAARGYSPY